MKLHLPLVLRSSLLACLAAVAGAVSPAEAFTPGEDLGDTMFVGDSITHGVNAKSWRWEIHKIFADNGISYSEVGIQYGSYSGGSNLNLSYGDSTWLNYHASQSSERAWDISGRKKSGRLGGTNIFQWLNLQEDGNYHIEASTTPNTYFMMIGTNDLLSDVPGNDLHVSSGDFYETVKGNLLGTQSAGNVWSGTGDMDTIIDAMRQKSGDDVDIVLLTVPTWNAEGRTNNQYPADLQCVKEYNEALKEWAAWKGVTVVDINVGLVDVANEALPWDGVRGMYGSDQLHPSAQGDLIIAGNVAKALGYAGRTAGQVRKSAAQFSLPSAAVFAAASTDGTVSQSGSALTFGTGASLSYSWSQDADLTAGYTVEFTLSGLGNGAADGWDTSNHFSLSLGNGSHGGTLNINEAYIQWGDSILYSIDTSAGLQPLRVAYVYGNSARGLASGFYVWLGDQLIGEGLTAGEIWDGVVLTNGSEASVTLDDIAIEMGSYAPWSNGYWATNPIIESSSANFPGRKEMAKLSALQNPGGSGEFLPDGQDSRMVDLSGKASQNSTLLGNFRSWLWDNSEGEAGRVVGGTLTGDHYYNASNASYFGITSGNYTGDIYANVEGAIWQGNWMAFQRGAGTLTGNGYLRYGEGAVASNQGVIFGVANAGSNGGIDGNLYFEFSSPDFTVAAGSFSGVSCSVAGVYSSGLGITGEFRVVVNAGTFGGAFIGGAIYNGNVSDSGKVSFYLNGGVFNGNIYGGGVYGSVESSYIEITGDDATFNGSVISAGSYNNNSNGAVTGDAQIKLSQVTSTERGIGAFTGTISGGWKDGNGTGTRSLEFSGTTLEELNATIENFDSILLSDDSKVGLSSFGGASSVTVNGGSVLTVLEDLEVDKLDNMGKVVVSSGKSLSIDGVEGVDMQALVGTYVLEDSELSMGAATNGIYTVEVSGTSALSLASQAEGSYSVQMATGSELTLHADGFAGDISLSMSGSGTVSADSVGSASLSVDDSAAAGQGTFTLGGGLSITEITLTQLSGGSQVTGIAGDGALTLSGESSIVLTASMQNTAGAMLLTNRALAMGDGATLKIDVNSIVGDVTPGSTVAYYLTQGDLSALANAGVVFDATLAVLGWEVEYGTDGALRFTAHEKSGIYKSSDKNAGTSWGVDGSENIYVSVDKYGVVLVNKTTEIDLSNETVPSEYQEDGLMVKNLVGTEGAELTITGKQGGDTRVTISNTLSEMLRKNLESELNCNIEDSLTFAGNIKITDAELQIKHVDPDLGEGKADSTTIVKGNLTLEGSGGLTMTSGVLRLEGADNTLDSGDVRFAGNDGQIVVATGATLSVAGAMELTGDEQLNAGRTEHVLIENNGTLELNEGASVGRDIVLGSDDAAHTGTVSVLGSDVQAHMESRLSHVVLNVQGSLLIASKDRAGGSGNAWELAGLTGNGVISSADSKDMRFTMSDNCVFSGDLSAYQGDMTFTSSPYTQSFKGVTGGKGWNVINESNGRVIFDLSDSASNNTLTMGKLTLMGDSYTSIFLDVESRSGAPGLSVQELEAYTGAHLTIGHGQPGMATLSGNNGELVTLAVISVEGDDHDFDKIMNGLDVKLKGIRNADEDVIVYYDAATKTLLLMTYLDDDLSYPANATNANAAAGARMIRALSNTYQLGGDLAKIDEVLYEMLKGSASHLPGNSRQANKIMAAVAGASVSTLSQALSDDIERQLHSIRNRTTMLGSTDDQEQQMNVWLNAEGSYRKQKENQDEMLPGYRLTSWGGTVGAAANLNSSVGVGFAITAMYGDLESKGPDRLKGDMDMYYASAFIHASSGAWRHTALATVGHALMDVKRTVDYSVGSYTTSAHVDGSAFGFMYEAGYSIMLASEGSALLQPIFNISLRHARVDGYSESGSTNATLSVGAQSYTSLTYGVGARFQMLLGEEVWNRPGVFELRGLFKLRSGDTAGEASVSFNRVLSTQEKVKSASVGRVGAEFGAGLSIPITEMCNFFAEGGVEIWNRYTDVSASIGVMINF